MKDAPKTLEALDAFTHRQTREERRKHLGASVMGDKCDRKVFYKWRWAVLEEFSARMKRLFRRGHDTETPIVDMVRGAGMEVIAAGQNGEDKESLRITDCGGHFGGTPDGVLPNGCPDMPGVPMLLECKTHNDKQFAKLEKDGLFTAFLKYYVQMQIYMHKLKLSWGLYFGVNKNDDSIYLQLVKADERVAAFHLARARGVIYAKTIPPRISETPGYFECKYCLAYKVCHEGADPDKNCRTCAFSLVGPAKEWQCTKNRPEIYEQTGCPKYQLSALFKPCQNRPLLPRPQSGSSSRMPPPPPPPVPKQFDITALSRQKGRRK